ncbi:hypothetical protein [Bradyrhizobium sp.]|uniref:esterase/lipase family protein n=1 Tax=Bradyrhizobium sp. TaxID=376 RepID=UPI001EC12EE8|nr:hypothetical protein [Bradyrhizobium sp.]MBV9982316.1 hypothetical protein [Bradyrhizobium sp.]
MKIQDSAPAVEQARATFEAAASDIDLHEPGELSITRVPLQDLRRRRRRDISTSTGAISLVERDGVLHWRLGPIVPVGARVHRRFRVRSLGRTIAKKEFVALGQNEIGGYLESLDRQLTPHWGLSQWDTVQKKLTSSPAVLNQGKILLFIHGNFSSGQHLFDEIRKAPNGDHFLTRAGDHYQQILAFDHPTVSVSPMINAVDLRRALAGSMAQIDVVCHSRGGLVARWWLESFGGQSGQRRAIFVGSPLTGTSLASPARLRAGLNVLANFSKLLGTAAMGVPFMKAPAALLRVIGSVVGVTSRAPLLDAALAMIPGLNGQSRIENNAELIRLNQGSWASTSYSFVVSDFETGNRFAKRKRAAQKPS